MLSLGADLDDFSCPICFDVMDVPILQCTNGHSVCNTCKTKFNKCPTCQADYGSGRNYTLENIMTKLRIDCKNEFCKEVVSLITYRQHIDQLCIGNIRTCGMPACSWKDSRDKILAHVQSAHPAYLVQCHENIKSQQSDVCFVRHEESLFLVKRHVEGFVYLWTVEVKTRVKPGTTYALNLKIKDANGDQYMFQQNCASNPNISEADLVKQTFLTLRIPRADGCTFKYDIRTYDPNHKTKTSNKKQANKVGANKNDNTASDSVFHKNDKC